MSRQNNYLEFFAEYIVSALLLDAQTKGYDDGFLFPKRSADLQPCNIHHHKTERRFRVRTAERAALFAETYKKRIARRFIKGSNPSITLDKLTDLNYKSDFQI